MAQGELDITIDRPADEVWGVVGDFGAIAEWSPGMDSCERDGDIRTIKMMGMEITERLVNHDDAGRTLTYAIAGGVPVEKHQATITVFPQGDSSRVTWAYEVEPDSMGDILKGTYGGGLAALKAHCEI